MVYAQTSFPQIQGINGRYSIHDIGCFLTAFCNLLGQRYGKAISPLDLNGFFVQHGNYVDVDDGVRDDLAWSTIKAYLPQIVVTRVVDKGTSQTAGLPGTNQAIVKFYYKSTRTGKWGTHFSLYDGGGYIIDSWDGVRKKISSTSYGNPVAFAEYAVPAPAAAAAAPQQVIVQGDEMITDANQAHLAYQLLRPNGDGSDGEISATAGKRSWAQFARDAQNEVIDRNRNLRDQAQNLSAAQQANASLNATVQDLNNKLNDASLSNTEKQKALDAALTQIAADNATVSALHEQLSTLQKAVPAGQVLDQALSTPTTKVSPIARIFALMLKLKK